MAINSNKIVNVGRTKAVTQKEAIAIANRQIWQRTFSPDYDQVMLRISTAPLNSLVNGGPPPTAS